VFLGFFRYLKIDVEKRLQNVILSKWANVSYTIYFNLIYSIK